MKTNYLFSAIIAGVFIFTASRAEASTQPEPEGYRYDINPGGMNLSLFKLFTIQPAKKEPEKRAPRVSGQKEPEKKAAQPVTIDRSRKLL